MIVDKYFSHNIIAHILYISNKYMQARLWEKPNLYIKKMTVWCFYARMYVQFYIFALLF